MPLFGRSSNTWGWGNVSSVGDYETKLYMANVQYMKFAASKNPRQVTNSLAVMFPAWRQECVKFCLETDIRLVWTNTVFGWPEAHKCCVTCWLCRKCSVLVQYPHNCKSKWAKISEGNTHSFVRWIRIWVSFLFTNWNKLVIFLLYLPYLHQARIIELFGIFNIFIAAVKYALCNLLLITIYSNICLS